MNTDTSYKIRPAGRHLLTIGRDLIKDNYAAVVELVKNAYDADSPDVNIKFKAFPNRSGYSIVISDHGHGMSKEDVINKWLVPSTPDKIDRRKSFSGRIMQGSKGVGRYAASILGKDLLLETVTTTREKTTAHLKWHKFEKAQYLDDVEIPIKTTKVSEQPGTQLTIKGDDKLLAEWNKDGFDKLRFELKKLTPPVIPTFSNGDSGDTFCINLTIKGFPQMGDIEETIEPYPLLDLFDYQISGKISKEGRGNLTYSSQKARNIPIEKIPFDFRGPTGCGELDVDIRVYDREAEAIDSLIKRGLIDESGNYVGKNQARQLLNVNNGIGVYRNGFRIRPLGDTDFDWLKLNARRVQNPSVRIGSNQVIGYVQIQAENQSRLIEKSARDGLKENKAFDQLKDITEKIIAELEKRRFSYRSKAGLSRPALKVEQELERLFLFDDLKHKVRGRLTKDKVNKITTDEIIEIINQDEKDKNRIAEELRKTIATYQGQATLGKIVNIILHQSGTPLNCINNDVPNLWHWCELFSKTGDSKDLEDFMSIADGIKESANTLAEFFEKLDPLAAKKRSNKTPLKLKEALQQTLDFFKKDLTVHKVSTVISGSDKFKFLCWKQDFYVIFTNLIDNSIYWMSEKEIPNRKIFIELVTDGDSLRYINYRDTGPGINSDLSDLIFEPEFTTKQDGMGLGLAIAGEASTRNGLELKALESDEGAYFRLQPRKESGDE